MLRTLKMPDRVPKCPNCGATVKASRFARVATCTFCSATVHLDDGVISVERFREAYRAWHAPEAAGAAVGFDIGDDRWADLGLFARGEISDVHVCERVRWPRERALVKRLRSDADAPLLEQEWRALQTLADPQNPGAELFAGRVPQPIARDSRSVVVRWLPRFETTLEQARAAFPAGIDARVAVWMWRRALEVLSYVHNSGLVHGAVLPQHLVAERGDHGLLLVGFSCAAARGGKLLAMVSRYESFYPRALLDSHALQPIHDLQMSARTIGHALGADAAGALPHGVPAQLRDVIEQVWRGDAADAWTLRETLGVLARQIFGPPSFNPLVMP